MVNERTRQLTVSHGARLLGVIGLDEIIRDVVAKGIPSAEIRAEEAATTQFACLGARCSLAEAADTAEASNVRYLVLMGSSRQPVGLLAPQLRHRAPSE